MRRLRHRLGVLALAAGLLAWPTGRAGHAQSARFTDAYLKSPEAIELGREVWAKRCHFCHGRAAYPGKAPRLDPSRYTPEFVYDRVANGFRGMPPWKHEFSESELQAVVAYVLSQAFSP